MDAGDQAPERVCLDVAGRANRRLLRDLLSEYDLVSLDDGVPEGTDLCVVDDNRLDAARVALEAWRADERPAYAPVLLLASETSDPWQTYRGVLGDLVDGIQPIPASRRSIESRIDGLLQTRSYSVLAKERLEQLELYERGMDGATIGITIADATDPELPLVYVNDGFLELTGYDRDRALGRNCRYLQGEATEEATIDEIRAALDNETPVTVDIRNYRQDGELFWNRLHIEPIRDRDGTVTHFLGFQQDVTERKTREILLEQYEHIVQAVSDPIMVLDDAERILYANGAARSLFGIDQLEVGLAASVEPRLAASLQRAIAETDETGDPALVEVVVAGGEGTQFTLQARVKRTEFDRSTATDRILVVARDVTSIRDHQNRLSVLDRVLRHNIRNKLTTVLGTVDHLVEASPELDSVDAETQLTRIEDAATDLLDISNAARQFNETIDPATNDAVVTDLQPIVADTVAVLEREYPDLSIESNYGSSTAALCPPNIRAVVDELLNLAVSDTTDSVALAVRRIDEQVVVELSTSGPCLTEREHRVLARGSEQQLDHTTGVSLWLVKWAVTSSGGELTVSDDRSRISLRFPAE